MFPFPSMMNGKQALLAVLDPANTGSSITLSNGNRRATGSNGFQTSRTLTLRSTGKFYVEAYQNTGGGELGIVKSSHVASGSLVAAATSAACQTSGVDPIYVGATSQGINLYSGGPLTTGDRLCMAVDLDNNRIWFRKNAEDWNANPSANPATNANGVDISTWRAGAAVYCALGGPVFSATINAGVGQWIGTAPAGFDEVRDY